MRHRWLLVAYYVLRWVGGLLLIFLVLAAWDYNSDRAPAGSPMGEQVTQDEEFLTAQLVSAAVDVSVQFRSKLIDDSRKASFPVPSSVKTSPGYSPSQYRREAHAKGHGCVIASFSVGQVDSRFAYGVFATPHTYDALIRFSSGNPEIQPDSKDDARGMAVKLFGVPGRKLLPFEQDDTTQDFIMMNNPVFFIRTIQEYTQFSNALAAGRPTSYFIPGFNILKWHLRELRLGKGTQKPRPDSLVAARYWSASSYTLGPGQYVKYSAIPCSGGQNRPKPVGSADSFDYLRTELAKQSETGGACFDLAVQPQVLGKNMPIEDSTVEWKESDSAFIPVAHIVIKPSLNNTAAMNDQCENTAFNPWHALEAHRPVGAMNRVRKALYQAMSRFRQIQNCADNCDRNCNHMQLPDNACASTADTTDTYTK